jgi:catechol 2,3-dioxygenase
MTNRTSILPATTHTHSASSETTRRALIPFAKSAARHEADRAASTNVPERARKLRLGHVHVKVRDLARSLPFYRDLLGLRLTERAGRFAFLAIGDEHHSVALEEVGGWSSRPSRRTLGVAHVAFEAPDLNAFLAARRKLVAGRLPIINRNNGISWTMRFGDPDDNEIEIYLDRRRVPTGTWLWGGRWHDPFRPEDDTASRPSLSNRPQMETSLLK